MPETLLLSTILKGAVLYILIGWVVAFLIFRKESMNNSDNVMAVAGTSMFWIVILPLYLCWLFFIIPAYFIEWYQKVNNK